MLVNRPSILTRWTQYFATRSLLRLRTTSRRPYPPRPSPYDPGFVTDRTPAAVRGRPFAFIVHLFPVSDNSAGFLLPTRLSHPKSLFYMLSL